MNWQHLHTLLWVRWRLTINHARRQGVLPLIIMAIGGGLALTTAAVGFFAALIAGLWFLPDAPADVLMYVCDGWVLGFLFFWMIGVVSELQRGEMLSLDKLLHLPTTLTEVYLFNFLSSLVTLSTLTFVPPLLGFAIAAVVAKGPAALVLFPLIAAFVLMVSAVTYQFRGWLASLMVNKHRQRTVMAFVMIIFVAATQVPNVIFFNVQKSVRARDDNLQADSALVDAELQRTLQTGEITPAEFTEQFEAAQERRRAERRAQNQMVWDQINRALDIFNLALPIGWMAYGAKAAAAGNPWPGLAGALGMFGIAALSLRRSYYTTLRYFRANFTGQLPAVASTAPKTEPVSPRAVGTSLVERTLPLASERVAAVAWTTFRTLTRAPEVKLVLMSPLILLVLYGAMVRPTFGGHEMPAAMKSFLPLAAMALALLGTSQLSHNLFGFDRSGFRAYVLTGVPRHQVLMGKNLALAPLVLALVMPLLILLQVLVPAPWTHFLAALLLIPTAFLLLSLLGNISSILCPVGIAAGSLKPAEIKFITMLVQFLFLMATLAIISSVMALPLALELLLQFLGVLSQTVPLALLLVILELVGAGVLYRAVIRLQGDWLQSRECTILETVIEKGE